MKSSLILTMRAHGIELTPYTPGGSPTLLINEKMKL
jgi:hypothetical protein